MTIKLKLIITVKIMTYVEKYEKMALGLFVHFGIYSVIGKGEWINFSKTYPNNVYAKYADKFNPKKTWAKEIVSAAKKTGCKWCFRFSSNVARHTSFANTSSRETSCCTTLSY